MSIYNIPPIEKDTLEVMSRLNDFNKGKRYPMSFSGCDIKVYAVVNELYYTNLLGDLQKQQQEYLQEIEADKAQYEKDARDLLKMEYLYRDNPHIVGAGDIGQLYRALVNNTQTPTEREANRDNGINKLLKSPIFIELGEIQTLSYSVYRDKEPVRSLGYVSPKGYGRGPITMAGTMIFTVLYEKVMHEIFNFAIEDKDSISLDFVRVDQLPPLDIIITFANEVGNFSRMGIFGVEFLNEGQVMSVADLITENSVNYVARHVSPMRSIIDSSTSNEDFLKIYNSSSGYTLGKEDYDIAKDELTRARKRFL